MIQMKLLTVLILVIFICQILTYNIVWRYWGKKFLTEARKKELEAKQSEKRKILSRINEIIRIGPYDYDTAYSILFNRCLKTFQESVISEEILKRVVDLVIEKENMRHGIEILRNAGLYADKIIKMMVKKAYDEGYRRLGKRAVIGLAIFKACEILKMNIFQSFIGKNINISEQSIRDYRKLYQEYSENSSLNLECGIK